MPRTRKINTRIYMDSKPALWGPWCTTAVLGLIMLGTVQPLLAADLVCGSPQAIGVSEFGAQQFTIPTVDPPSFLRLTTYGADGGGAVLRGNNVCSQAGGQGATSTATFRVGFGHQELNPGGTISFIIGDAGGDGDADIATGGRAGGGGGGTGIMYRAPGTTTDVCGTDWIVLVAAGGGGGGYQGKFAGACVDGHTGRSGTTENCGSAGGGGNGGARGCNGLGGGTRAGRGGGGAFADVNLPNKHGCPEGGAAENGNHGGGGGWGFGGGGGAGFIPPSSVPGGGGGGGYSGGGGGAAAREGGGGGSFVSSWAIHGSGSITEGNGAHVQGEAVYECIPNDTCAFAKPVEAGTTTFSGGVSERWFRVSSSCAGDVTIDTFGSNFDTLLCAYAECDGAFLGCNDDADGTLQSRLTVNLAPLQQVLVRITSFEGANVFPGQLTVTPVEDPDWDGVCGVADNCPDTANADQADDDLDGIGDVCDPCVGFNDTTDSDGDGVPNGCDLCYGNDDSIDCDSNGIPDLCDLTRIGRFESFGGGISDYMLNGNATMSNGSVRLTEAQPAQIGSVIFEPVSDLPVENFFVQFDIRMGGGTGADGMAFALIDADAAGNDLVFGETGGNQPLAISFDTYGSHPGDANDVALFAYGVEKARVQLPYQLDNNTWYRVIFFYDGDIASLSIRDSAGNFDYVFLHVFIPEVPPLRARYGFGGRTGGVTNEHRVDNVRFQVLDVVNDCDMNGTPDTCEIDSDSDGAIDACDNCPGVANFEQLDGDSDGLGDACDPCAGGLASGDADGDGDVDADDYISFNTCHAGPGVDMGNGCECFDFDADNDNDLLDFAEFGMLLVP